jgi:hypothetical protein
MESDQEVFKMLEGKTLASVKRPTCYFAGPIGGGKLGNEVTAKGKPPVVTCYLPPMTDKVEKGGESPSKLKNSKPTAACYIPVDSSGPFYLGEEQSTNGLSDTQKMNRLRLMQEKGDI